MATKRDYNPRADLARLKRIVERLNELKETIPRDYPGDPEDQTWAQKNIATELTKVYSEISKLEIELIRSGS